MVRPTLIELAVRVLRAAVERAKAGPIDGPEVRLALRCILPLATDRGLLVEFWTYAGQLPNANRADSCRVVLEAIVADLRSSARYPNANLEARRFAAEAVMQLKHEREAEAQAKRRHYWAPPPRRQ